MTKIHTFPRVRDAESRRSSTYRVRGRSVVTVTEEFSKPDAVVEARSAFRNEQASPNPQGNPLQAGTSELDRLYGSLNGVTPASNPRTAKLLGSSTRKAAQKVIEEAGEVALEAVKHRARGVVNESVDLLYHLVVLWQRAGVDPAEVWTEMRRRADAFGIAEKLPKPLSRIVSPFTSKR
jgi:phosphoribosyl-ATP pyrophosphohydrolase